MVINAEHILWVVGLRSAVRSIIKHKAWVSDDNSVKNKFILLYKSAKMPAYEQLKNKKPGIKKCISLLIKHRNMFTISNRVFTIKAKAAQGVTGERNATQR
ncbi:MAG: hypothetical protein JWQ09_21 [Segetibacter sp.]|nr:hypothetical protein [Segetibacter sp.]